VLERFGIYDKVGRENVFAETRQAIAAVDAVNAMDAEGVTAV
jgi:hypothetical protein